MLIEVLDSYLGSRGVRFLSHETPHCCQRIWLPGLLPLPCSWVGISAPSTVHAAVGLGGDRTIGFLGLRITH